MFARRVFSVPGFGLGSPFSELDRMRRQMEELSDFISRGRSTGFVPSSGVFPLIKLTEDADSYHLRAELPGLQAEDLDIQVTGRNLTISGERKIQSEGENVKYHRREREGGKFSRIVGMPGDIDADKVGAKMENGLLMVTIPKPEVAKPRQIAVN